MAHSSVLPPSFPPASRPGSHRPGPRRRIAGRAAVAALGVLLALAPARAAFKQISLEELVGSTDEILVIRVVDRDQVMDWMEGVAEPVPFQRLRCEVVHALKGRRESQSIVTLFVPGGSYPDGGQFALSTAPAVESYLEGESLVFLDHDSRYAPPNSTGIDAGDHGIYKLIDRKGSLHVRAKEGSPIERTVPFARLATRIQSAVAARTEDAEKGEGR